MYQKYFEEKQRYLFLIGYIQIHIKDSIWGLKNASKNLKNYVIKDTKMFLFSFTWLDRSDLPKKTPITLINKYFGKAKFQMNFKP